MFAYLGRAIACHPAFCVLSWSAVLVAGVLAERYGFLVAPPGRGEILPSDASYSRALALLHQAFPQLAADSQIVVVAVRDSGLTAEDFRWLDQLGRAAGAVTGRPVLSPAVPYLRTRLTSRNGQAALLVINLMTSFVSPRTVAMVEQVIALARAQPPAGLIVEVDGTAAMGRDYARATQAGAARTTWATVLAVLAILVLVYRSPIGALVPLVSIGASAYVAFLVLKLLARVGWEFSAMEWVFCVVLIFGAGIDYALFWIARYQEELGAAGLAAAALAATTATGPAILAGAATTICGLTTMIAAKIVPSQTAGKVLAAALAVNLLAALTLTPALARLLGRGLFWPAGPAGKVAWGSRRWWPWLARRVTGHPQAVLAVGSLALAVPALVSLRLEPHYGAVFDLPAHAPAKRAFRLIEQHFSKGQLDSATLLLEFAAGTQLDADRLSAQIAAALQASPGVANVYALSTPLGEAPGSASLPAFLLSLARGYYLSQSAAGAPVLRFEILMNDLPATRAAATTLQRAATTARQLAAPYSPTVLLAGPTAYILNERNIADADQRRVIVLATVVIAIIVLAIVRDVPLTLFMVLATWLTYGATLTLSDLFFVHVLGLAGLDWKVRLILFVIVVAVGQDYNIFLVTRLREEVRHQAALPATQAAIVRTGPVISSCGLIMAATLGSLVAGGLPLLRELGLALALGILIDTFFVRPLLIPAFFLVFGRRRRDGAPAGGRGPAGV